MKSRSIWNARSPNGIGDVVRPRAVTYSGTCHQWLSGGARASRTFPTIWSHRCSVEIVGSQSRHGSSGHWARVVGHESSVMTPPGSAASTYPIGSAS